MRNARTVSSEWVCNGLAGVSAAKLYAEHGDVKVWHMSQNILIYRCYDFWSNIQTSLSSIQGASKRVMTYWRTMLRILRSVAQTLRQDVPVHSVSHVRNNVKA